MTAKKRAIIITAAALVILAAAVVPLSLYFTGIIDYAEPARGDFDTAYLMAYFTGNEPEEERIYFALSRDGYNFAPVSDTPVLQSTTGTGSVRDPYIFAMNDGTYCIIATDMRSELGWSSNHAFTVFKSDDLINWTEYNVDIEPLIPDTVRAWEPQAIWDGKRVCIWCTGRTAPTESRGGAERSCGTPIPRICRVFAASRVFSTLPIRVRTR